MPIINSHFPHIIRTHSSPQFYPLDSWTASKGAKVVIPNGISIVDEPHTGRDLTEYAIPNRDTYPDDVDSCNILFYICGFQPSDGRWESHPVTAHITLRDANLSAYDDQPIQMEGKEPTLRFKVFSQNETIDVPSDQVHYSFINGVEVSGAPKWGVGVGTQKYTAYCNIDSETNTISEDGNLRLYCYGTATVCGFGVEEKTLYIGNDGETTSISLPIKLVNVSSPSLSISPPNGALLGQVVGNSLNFTIQNSALNGNEQTFTVRLYTADIDASYEFKVSKRVLAGITYSGSTPSQFVGSNTTLGDLKFTARYVDGTTKVIPHTSLTIDTIVPSDASTMALNVSYTDGSRYSYTGRNNASTVVYCPVYGIRYLGDGNYVDPDENGDYPSVESMFDCLSEETLTFDENIAFTLGANRIKVNGSISGDKHFTVMGRGDIGSMEVLTDSIVWSDDGVQVRCSVETDGSQYFHSSVSDITSDKTSCNIVGTISENGEYEFDLDATGSELNVPRFTVKCPNGVTKDIDVYAVLDTSNTVFPTTVTVGSNREWVPSTVSISKSSGCTNCLAPSVEFNSDEGMSVTYAEGVLTIRETAETLAGETYTFTLNGDEHDVKFLGKFASATIASTRTVRRGTTFEVTPTFSSEDSGVPVHKSEMPVSWYLMEMVDEGKALTIDGMKVTVNQGSISSTGVGLILNWDGNGTYRAIPESLYGDVSAYVDAYTTLGITGECEVSFAEPITLEADHTYMFESSYWWASVADGDELSISFMNGTIEVYRIDRVGRYREYDGYRTEGSTEIANTGNDIPVGIDNTDGRYLDSEGESYTKTTGTLYIPISVGSDTAFDKIVITADVHDDDEFLLVDPKITDLGECINLITGGEIEDSMPEISDYLEVADDGSLSFKATPNIGLWDTTTGKLEDDIDAVSFKSNTISILKDHYYYITGIPLQYENYKYMYMNILDSGECRSSEGFVYKPSTSANTNVYMTYDGHSGTIDDGDIAPWELKIEKFRPYVLDMGTHRDDDECWDGIRARNFIGFETPVSEMSLTITN